MKLFDILKQQGLFANDIRIRIKNKQISINGIELISDLDLDIELDEDRAKIFQVGNFLFDLIKVDPIFIEQLKIFGFENLFDSNIDNKLTKILNQFIFVKISKKEFFILKKNESKRLFDC